MQQIYDRICAEDIFGGDMESFIFAVNAVLPIILMVVVGYFIKRIGFIDAEFVKKANKIVFRVFLPAMLFLNVYKIGAFADIDFGYVIYAVAVTLAVFFVMLPLVRLVTRDNSRRGPLLQASFRSNYALVGIPLATSLFGSAGASVATLLSVALIPTYNMLAVISLSLFRKGENERGALKLIKRVLLGVVKNPLIISIAAGCAVLLVRGLFVELDISFRLTDIEPIYKVLESLSAVSTPLSLIVLGGQFEFSAIKTMRREILTGTLVKGVIVPILALGAAYVFFRDSFGGAHFAAFVAAFATPTGVSTVPMAQEMEGDVSLAGQFVVWTTLVSGFVIFFVSFFLKQVGVF